MKCATALGPSSKECRQLSKMLYKATNFTEDPGNLRKELEQMEPSIRSALYSGQPRNDQDVEDTSEYTEEEESTTEITQPSQESMGTTRRSSSNLAVSSASRNDEDAKETRERLKQRRLSIGSSKRLHRPGNVIWKKIDKKAKDFVETQKSVD